MGGYLDLDAILMFLSSDSAAVSICGCMNFAKFFRVEWVLPWISDPHIWSQETLNVDILIWQEGVSIIMPYTPIIQEM